MKYAHIDGNNNIIGWYDVDIHDNIPTPNIEVSDDVWEEALSVNANVLESGKPINKDKRTKEEKDKDTEDEEWGDYQSAKKEVEKEAEKEAWILAGKPKYK